jgi:hypothetical protein
MPDATELTPPRDRALRWLSLLLPREFRERVFQPSLADMHLDEAAAGPRRWARLELAVACLRIGLPLHFWRRSRPTRVALALGVMAIVVAFVVARLHYAAQWRAESLHGG